MASTERKIRKGMVLAAGLGTRLLPITEKTPKPLVPVLNVPNVLYSLSVLKRAGVRDVVLNLHHLPEPLEKFLGDGSKWGMHFEFSKESLLLGTGGGLKKAQGFFEGEPLILINCDFITDIDLTRLVDFHQQRSAVATMVLLENSTISDFYSKVGIDSEGRLCSLPRHSTGTPVRTGVFTGIHILENEVFKYLKEVPSGINEVLYPVLMKERPDQALGCFMDGTYWYDTGELHYLWKTSMDLLARLESGDAYLKKFLADFGGFEEKQPGVWAPSAVALPKGVKFYPPVVLGRDCQFGERATLGPYAILSDEANVGEDAAVSWAVTLGACEVPPQKVTANLLQFQHLSVPMEKAR